MSPETETGAGSPASEPAERDAVEAAEMDVVDEVAPLDAEAAESVEDDIESLLSERDQFKDIALRLQADFENYRRRMNAQTSEEIDRATGRVVEGLLPVLDACEAAIGEIVTASAGLSPVLLIGAPLRNDGRLYNCALVIADG